MRLGRHVLGVLIEVTLASSAGASRDECPTARSQKRSDPRREAAGDEGDAGCGCGEGGGGEGRFSWTIMHHVFAEKPPSGRTPGLRRENDSQHPGDQGRRER